MIPIGFRMGEYPFTPTAEETLEQITRRRIHKASLDLADMRESALEAMRDLDHSHTRSLHARVAKLLSDLDDLCSVLVEHGDD